MAIEARGLAKHFGRQAAVEGIDLNIEAGSVFAILGPNGAGKSVTVGMLTTLLRPDGGTAFVFGHDVVADAAAVRRCIAVTGQFASVDEDMTGRDNLQLLGRLAGFGARDAGRRADELLAGFGLTDAAGRSVRGYSGGMRRRLDIAASLIRRPRLLFLDEPTTGLDPASRNHVWQTVRALADEGVTILLTTQYLEEADRLAGRMVIMNRGRIIAEGTAQDLKAAIGRNVATIRLADDSRAAHAVSALGAFPHPARNDGDRIALPVGSLDEATDAAAALAAAGIEIAEFAYGQPSLDEAFLALTGDGPTSAAITAGA